MKKLFLGLIATVCTLSVFAGAGDWAWAGIVAAPAGAVTRIAVDSNENLYIDNSTTTGLRKWTNFAAGRADYAAYEAPASTDIVAGAGNGFQCIAVDDSDNVYTVMDYDGENDGFVKKFDSTGTELWSTVNPMGSRYGGGDLNADGNLFAMSFNGNTQLFNGADGTASDPGFNFAGDTYFRGASMDKTNNLYYVMKSGTLTKVDISAQSYASFGAGTWADTSWKVGPSCDFFEKDQTIIATDETTIHVIDAATGNELQTLVKINDSTNYDATFPCRGVVAYTVGDTDYMVVSYGAGGGAVVVYEKATTSAVKDWTLLDK